MALQTLSKSFKLVPIMLMGKLLTNKNYPLYEYAVAASIGLGNTLFMVRHPSTRIGLSQWLFSRLRAEAWIG